MDQKSNLDNCLREVRKLLSILSTYGNVLVPSLEGNTGTSAKRRLDHFVGLLESEHGMSYEQIESEISKLE